MLTTDVSSSALRGVTLFAPDEAGAGLLGGVPFNAQAVIDSVRDSAGRALVAEALGVFTREQLNVIHHVVNTNRGLVVRSTAGSGKSRTLRVISYLLPAGHRIVGITQNKYIAAVLKSVLPPTVDSSTFHSLGQSTVVEHAPCDAVFSQFKRKNIVDHLLKEQGRYKKGEAKALLQLVRATMTRIAKSQEEIAALVSTLELVFPADWDLIALVTEVQGRALAQFTEKRFYDYEDMLYLPLKMGYGYGSIDVALVDEAQDFSRLQHRLLRHLLGKHGRPILVGDEAQGVNEFAGADSDGMNRAVTTYDAVALRLTISFRLPTSHVELAKEFSDGIQAAPGAREGEIIRCPEEELLDILRPGDLVVARRNAPVISLALRLASQGVPVEVLGHDLAAVIKTHVERALAYPFTLAELPERLEEYGMSRHQAHYEAGLRGKVLRRALMDDRDLLECIAVVAWEVADRAALTGQRGTGADVLGMFTVMLSAKNEKAVKLCTIHKAKGLEAARVAVLDTDEVVHAGRDAEQPGDRALAFVATSRATHTLYLAGPQGAGHPFGEGDTHDLLDVRDLRQLRVRALQLAAAEA